MQKAMLLKPMLALLTLVLSSPRLYSQACKCGDPFGSCIIKKGALFGEFPGAAVIVPRTPPPADSTQPLPPCPPANAKTTDGFLYVADFFSGFTCRYIASDTDKATTAFTFQRGSRLPARQTSDQIFCFPSPAGSGTTTGLAFRQDGSSCRLIWAVEDSIYTTDIDGNQEERTGTVRLEDLAKRLRQVTSDPSLPKGALGGITFHAKTGTLWGVDYINDVYFEFKEDGTLVPSNDNPNFFFSPRRNKLTGGAYGNSIAYLESGGVEYFDLPVGSLADRKPTEVIRVHASNGTPPDNFQVGDEAGISYSLVTSKVSTTFVTGIAFWSDPCSTGAVEFLLDMGVINGSPAPQILEITAKEPAATSLADFRCEKAGPSAVTLTWSKARPYTSLKITRAPIKQGSGQPVTVFENNDFANDPEKFVDRSVPDGSYEYAADATTGTQALRTTCQVTVGIGSLVSLHQFNAANAAPFAIATVGSEKILIADLHTGDAEAFDIDLNSLGILPGPFKRGLTVGLAYNSEDKNLYWVQNEGGQSFLQKTDVSGAPIGTPALINVPANLIRGSQLGDLSYDPVRKYFWAVDLLNNVLYGITPTGAIADTSKLKQIANPESNGLLSGGVEVAAAQADKVTLDIFLGKSGLDFPNQVGRFDFTPANLGTAGKEVSRLEIGTTTGATDFGGIAILESGAEKFEYIVAMDTRAVYKLRLTAEATGSTFQRGDVNNDSTFNISDPSFLLASLFKGGSAPLCQAAADADGSNEVNLSDAIYLFNYLFKGGPAPPAPFPGCGPIAGSTLPCNAACVEG